MERVILIPRVEVREEFLPLVHLRIKSQITIHIRPYHGGDNYKKLIKEFRKEVPKAKE